MIKVKLTFPYPHWPIAKQTPGSSCKWGDYHFYINQNVDKYDFWVVFNSLAEETEKAICPARNTLLITAEPPSVEQYDSKFVEQFGHIITCHKSIMNQNTYLYQQGLPWFVNKSFDELNETKFIEKTRVLSIITSNKTITKGHKQRYNFAMAIKSYFGNAVDLYGRGIRDFNDKWQVLSPYKYTICIENSRYEDYFTEKLADCYLAHTFPIYYGCSNINKYFSEKAYQEIDIYNIDKSIRTIESIISDSAHYTEQLPYVLEAKYIYLTQYNLFPLIVNYLNSKQLLFDVDVEEIVLKQKFSDPLSLINRTIKKIKRAATNT